MKKILSEHKLASKLAKKTRNALTIEEWRIIFNLIKETVFEEIADGYIVKMALGTFEVRKQKGKITNNLSYLSGDKITTPDKLKIKFKAFSGLEDKLNDK